MVYLRDLDGDGVSDRRDVIFSGLNLRDTHACTSNLRFGYDNWIYATVGYSGVEIEIAGKTIKSGSGVFRFRPDGSDLEVLQNTTNNTWGLGFSEQGDVVGSTANGNPSCFFLFPTAFIDGWGCRRKKRHARIPKTWPILSLRTIFRIGPRNRFHPEPVMPCIPEIEFCRRGRTGVSLFASLPFTWSQRLFLKTADLPLKHRILNRTSTPLQMPGRLRWLQNVGQMERCGSPIGTIRSATTIHTANIKSVGPVMRLSPMIGIASMGASTVFSRRVQRARQCRIRVRNQP